MKSLSRRSFLEVAAGTGLSASLGWGCGYKDNKSATEGTKSTVENAAVVGGEERPNIVLIIMDTVRADKLGCYGFEHSTSPALDALAAKGTVFERVIAQCSWTRPSCGSFLTSLYPRQLGLYKEKGEMLNDRFETLGKALKGAGYKTFGITANPNLNSIFNFHKGFDVYVDTNVVWGWMGQQASQTVRGGDKLPSAPSMFGQALDWAKAQEAGASKFVQVNAMEVHEWYFKNTMIRPEYQQEFLKSGEPYPKYLQSVRQLSDDVAKFVDELSALPGWENTLFAIIADHGEGLNEHPGIDKAMYHGWLLYESNVVVPWLLYNKARVPKTGRVKQSVRLLELTPTLLDYAGVAAPAGMEGVSVRSLAEGEEERVNLPEYFMCETNWREVNRIGVYAPEWKFFDNPTPFKGLPRHELQKKGKREAGIQTDQFEKYPEIANPLLAYAAEWEKKYPKVQATMPERDLTEEEKEQLRAIGYVPD